jgi:hypothetical protein
VPSFPHTHHDLQHVVRHGPLQRLSLIPWGAHPNIELLIGRQYQLDLRLRRVRLRLSRLAFAATFLRYCSTILFPEVPAIWLVLAFAAASITHHALGFALGRFAATYQIRDPQPDHAIAF